MQRSWLTVVGAVSVLGALHCAAPRTALRPHDPTRHEQTFVAVHPLEPRAIVLERIGDTLRLVEHGPSGTRAVGPTPSSPDLDAATWALLAQLGFVPFTEAHATPTRGDLRVHGETVQVHTATPLHLSVALLGLGAAPVEVVWRTTPESRFVGLEVRFDGAMTTRAAYLIDPSDARHKLLVSRASQAHQEGNYAQAVIDYTDVLSLKPDDTVASYNLACALARLGQYEAALTQLRRAIDTGGPRYQDYARQDPDFAELKRTLAFSELIGD